MGSSQEGDPSTTTTTGDFFASSPPQGVTNGDTSTNGRVTRARSRASLSPTQERKAPYTNGGSSLFIGGSSDDEYIPEQQDNDDDEEYHPRASKRPKLSPPKSKQIARAKSRSKSIEIVPDDDDEAGPSVPALPEWSKKYVGNFCVAGWALSKGRGYVDQGDQITIQRQRPKQANNNSSAKAPQKKQTKLAFGGKANSSTGASANSNGKAKQQEDYVVRFSNMRGFEVGRLPQEVAVWMSKLIDLDLATFEGSVVDCPPILSVGCDILLDIRAYLKREAFPAREDVRKSRNTENEPAKNFFQETAETSTEKELRQRKSALIRLFKACDLRPTQANDILRQHAEENQFATTSILDHYGGKDALRKSSSPVSGKAGTSNSPAPGKASTPATPATGTSTQTAIAIDAPKEEPEDTDANDGTEIEADQLSTVYSKAQKHDVNLPEEEPPDTFALTLRPYQKQALGWMKNMEKPSYLRKGKEGQRTEASLHPLWQEYKFPANPHPSTPADTAQQESEDGSFYFNPYIGEMSLEFQPASQGTRGGILADEMGLGKTIMVASLLHANRPSDDGNDDQDDNDADDRSRQVEQKGPRQTSLASAFASSSRDKRRPSAGRATLVIAPMSLVGQWVSEMEKASKPGSLTAMLYYAEGKADLVGRLEGGSVDVVVTSYGTLVSEYKRYNDAGGSSASATKVAKVAPLYAVDWLRVILDEAHSIRNRTTRNARACHDLMARRRWCLTGSPIVNRLTDLYSLLNFLRVEPWGDFSFFNSFIGKPFANKNPKALEIVQVVLESILLRREKKFKDKDGKPIVDLPSKTMDIQHLEFSEIERKIYDLCYDRAWVQYQRLRNDGSMSRNLSVIFSVLMKLRQAVCHPLLVLQAMQASHARAKEADEGNMGTMDEETEKEVKELVAKYQAGQQSDQQDAEDAVANLAEEGIDSNELIQGRDEEACPLCHDVKSEPSGLPCGHSACRSCLIEDMQKREDEGEKTVCRVCGQGPFGIQDVQNAVKSEGSKSIVANPFGKPSDREQLRSCTKLDALVSDLSRLRMEDPNLKGVIFSQFTSFLDLVEIVLKRHHHPFLRLDGSTSQKDRQEILSTFASHSSHMLILISLRAGGVGLNLTSANHVWLLDVWWAGQIEDQCIDRIHRIGQERDVFVHRYLIQNSIEDRILLIQNRKRILVSQTLGAASADDQGEESQGEMVENLKILFGDK
ncbi:unnamed protein product [Sympodiomycopsis kandeliae]